MMPLQYCFEPEFLLEWVNLENSPGTFIKKDETFKTVRTEAQEKVLGSQFFIKRTYHDKTVFWFEVVERKNFDPTILGQII